LNLNVNDSDSGIQINGFAFPSKFVTVPPGAACSADAASAISASTIAAIAAIAAIADAASALYSEASDALRPKVFRHPCSSSDTSELFHRWRSSRVRPSVRYQRQRVDVVDVYAVTHPFRARGGSHPSLTRAQKHHEEEESPRSAEDMFPSNGGAAHAADAAPTADANAAPTADANAAFHIRSVNEFAAS